MVIGKDVGSRAPGDFLDNFHACHAKEAAEVVSLVEIRYMNAQPVPQSPSRRGHSIGVNDCTSPGELIEGHNSQAVAVSSYGEPAIPILVPVDKECVVDISPGECAD